MTDEDKPVFAQSMAALCVAFGKESDAALFKVYAKALKDLEIEFLERAAMKIAQESKFFPKPSEWREAAEWIRKARLDDQKLRMRMRVRAGLPPLCSACNDVRWVACGDPHRRFRACDCVKLRWLEVLGRMPMPALPPGPEMEA